MSYEDDLKNARAFRDAARHATRDNFEEFREAVIKWFTADETQQAANTKAILAFGGVVQSIETQNRTIIEFVRAIKDQHLAMLEAAGSMNNALLDFDRRLKAIEARESAVVELTKH